MALAFRSALAAALLLGCSVNLFAGDAPVKAKPAKKADNPANAEVTKFVQEHHPELQALLKKLEKDSPKEHQAAMRQLAQTQQRLARLKTQAPKQYEASLADWKLESRAQVLAAKMTMSEDPALEAELKSLVAKRINGRLASMQIERDRIEERLTNLNGSIEEIQTDKDAAVQKELQRIKRSIRRNGKPAVAKVDAAKSKKAKKKAELDATDSAKALALKKQEEDKKADAKQAAEKQKADEKKKAEQKKKADAAKEAASTTPAPALVAAATPAKASLPATPQPLLPPVTARFAAKGDETPNFQRHVVPLLGKLGCNGRACHGSFQGRGGFRLSLFGYDFKMDHEALAGGKEPRVDLKTPSESLILQKPTQQIPHEGGERFKLGTWEHHVLLGWTEKGAKPLRDAEPTLAALEVTPNEINFKQQGERVQLKAIARWTDGAREDVTPLCRFQTNDEQIASIDQNGRVTSGSPGDSHVVVFYDTGVAPVAVIRPVSDTLGPKYPSVPTPTPIDGLVVQKLKKLGVVPSELCTDAEFLRRASLDVTGTLPVESEVKAFLADKDPQKRSKKVDELLERPAYAAWWTTRLCDITGNNDGALVNITPVGQNAANEWYDWMIDRVRNNVAYDKIVEAMLMANSRRPGQSYTDYAKEMTSMYVKDAKRDYADLPELTHFWARRTVAQPPQKALSFAYTFLGIRIQCAECHKHPFDQWTQEDYKSFSTFFTRVRYGLAPTSRKENADIVAALNVPVKKGNDLRREFPRLLAEGKTLPFNEVYVEPAVRRPTPMAVPKAIAKPSAKPSAKPAQQPPKNDKKLAKNQAVAMAPAKRRPITAVLPAQQSEQARRLARIQRQKRRQQQQQAQSKTVYAKLLGGDKIDISQIDDPRKPLMQWLRSEKNPFFARAFVNRVWAVYFNVGIVNPADDLSLANPPSNAELLDYLARGFVEHKYDMKWLHREIVNSRTYQMSWKPNDTNKSDLRNFSHSIPRRLPAEVALDAVRLATASDARVSALAKDNTGRAIAMAGAGRRGAAGTNYALNVFGRSTRESNCDCDRSNDPSLLQTVFLRNDNEVLAMLGDPKFGWMTQLSTEFNPKPAARPAQNEQPADRTARKANRIHAAKQQAKKSQPARPAMKPAPKTRQPIVAAIPGRSKPAALAMAKPKKNMPAVSNPQIDAIAERLKKAEAAGDQEKIAFIKKRLELAKKNAMIQAAATSSAATNVPAGPKATALTAAKKSDLVASAYLRTLSRYPEPKEAERALAHLADSQNIVVGMRDLVWALINTREFIVNH